MPFVSKKQQRWGHTKAGIKALGRAAVDEYDEKTRGKDLPESLSQFSPRKKKSHKFDEVRKRH